MKEGKNYDDRETTNAGRDLRSGGMQQQCPPCGFGVDSSALDQASVAFNGNPSPLTIKEKLDQAFRLYNTPISEENYSRAGSTLVALRRENGTDEMKILEHMIRSHVPGVNVTFPEAAALSSVALKVGD